MVWRSGESRRGVVAAVVSAVKVGQLLARLLLLLLLQPTSAMSQSVQQTSAVMR